MSDQIVVTSLLMSLITYGLIARWYVMPAIEHCSRAQALQPFLLLHSTRHMGLMFLAPGALNSELPAVFAQPAAWGDLLAAILALLALTALRLDWRCAIALVWVFNIEGTLDLLYALMQGVLTRAAGGMGAAFWIPTFVVPALLVTHILVFIVLLRSDRR